MVNKQNLLRQHNEIIELVQKIEAYQTAQQVAANAFEISLLLGQLSGKLKMHLAAEDRSVYPTLAAQGDSKLKMLSKNFAAEMGGLAQTFAAYRQKYLGAAKITADVPRFLTDTQTVFTALMRRLERENKELYPLLDD